MIDNSSGIISTVAGTGEFGFNGDGMPATNAILGGPQGLALDVSGNLFIADTTNQRIRRVAGIAAAAPTPMPTATPAPTLIPTAVPSLSQWGLLGMAGLFAFLILVGWGMRKRAR